MNEPQLLAANDSDAAPRTAGGGAAIITVISICIYTTVYCT